jgi:N-dimethylarginine dimethylaminohydrolase
MTTCHSEYGLLKSLFIKRAADAFSSDAIIDRDWKRLNFLSRPDWAAAGTEYAGFESVIARTGATIRHFPSDPEVTMDSIYCRDASIATDKGMILCHMGKAARQTEPQAQARAFQAMGVPVLGRIGSPGTVEGGDVAWLDDRTLAVGHTYRTNPAGIEQLAALLKPLGVQVVTVQLPHYRGPADVFHLMSILSPVDKDLAVVYSPLMPIKFRNELLERGMRLVEVPDAEFDSMGCNVLALGPRNVLMVKGNNQTKEALLKAGCKVAEYQGAEISVKGGGGPTCLTRPLEREL